MNESAVAGSVSPLLPLSLLESVRAHDRPEEILEDEDLTVSMPRRLGLSDVVDNQIRQYEAARKSGRSTSLDELASLIRLVLKRPDAEEILRETGRRMAEWQFERVPVGYVRMLRRLPRKMLVRAWRRTTLRLLDIMTGEADVEIDGQPPVVRIAKNPLVQLEPAGAACALYGASIEQLAVLFTEAAPYAIQTQCSSAGGDCCEWSVSGL